jgi:hypothetical protein
MAMPVNAWALDLARHTAHVHGLRASEVYIALVRGLAANMSHENLIEMVDAVVMMATSRRMSFADALCALAEMEHE